MPAYIAATVIPAPPLELPIDRSTKWPRQGKAIEHAQQNLEQTGGLGDG
jgi:hypothetical protein